MTIEVAWDAEGLLRTFNEAGVLGLADVHTAAGVGRIAGEPDETVRLALALAVRALRSGSVCLDLATAREAVFDDSESALDVAGLPWPAVVDWLAACRSSPLVTQGTEAMGDRPLRLARDSTLYLERYWQQEETVRLELRRRRSAAQPAVDRDRLAAGLERLFPRPPGLATGEPDRQRLAAAVSALRWVSVLAGGPGTGKTTTVARLLALLRDQQPAARIALAAPTGKAAARLEEAVRSAAVRLPTADQHRLGQPTAHTLHRLLGWRPGGRFRHGPDAHLPYDVVVVDEMSMVSLTLMARLLQAARPDTRLVLVGDPDQLSSVEAGAVLADVVHAPVPPDYGLAVSLEDAGMEPAESAGQGSAVVRLHHTWRFAGGGAISRLAAAVRAGAADEAVAVLRSGDPAVVFVEADLASPTAEQVARLAAETVAAGRQLRAAAADGDIPTVLAALDCHRLLCAHRSGPFGVARWSRAVEAWLAEAVAGYGRANGRLSEWYVGRPLLVTSNDYELNLYNGDTGAVVATPAGIRAAFARGGAATLVAPVRLDAVQTMHALTVHRAQGSQYRAVSFVLPPADSPLLTRELLYTAVTRASEVVYVYGDEAAVRRAVARPANRATGLRDRLG